MSSLFNNETVLISGGLGDIGQAIATAFAANGAHIALCDLHEPSQAREFLQQLEQQGIRARYQRVNVADADQVKGWVNAVEQELGVAGIVIANAATVTTAGILDITPAQWSRELQVNLDGAFYLTQTAAARLLANGRHGRIVLMGSWAAEAVHKNIPAYCVAKAGLRMLCRCLALELAPHDILVNELAPGFVDAGLSGKIFARDPDARRAALAKVPVQRLITASEVAQQVLLLCHPSNTHITGTTLLMDGGLSLLT